MGCDQTRPTAVAILRDASRPRSPLRSLAPPRTHGHDRHMASTTERTLSTATVHSRRTSGELAARIALAALVATVFARGLGGDFLYDDLALIARNPGLHDPADLAGLWSRPLWGQQLGHFRPLTAQLLAIGWWFGDGAAFGIHAIALSMHVWAFFGAARLVRELGIGVAAALVTATCFALHPSNAEAVCWSAALNDVMVGAFAIHGLSAWLRWRRNGNSGARIAALACAAAAMLSKEPGVFVPALYLASDLALGRGRQAALRAAPLLLVLVTAWLALRMLVFGEVGAGFDRTTYVHEGSGISNAIAVGASLVHRLLWPVSLCMFDQLTALSTLPTLVFALLLLALVMLWRHISGPSRLGLLLVAASVLPPMLTVANLGPYPIADRYLYLATLGLALLVGDSLARVRRGPALMTALLALPFCAMTALRVPMFGDQKTFVERSLSRYPEDARLHYMYGTVLLEQAERGDATMAPAAAAAFRAARQHLGNDLLRQDHLAALRRDVAIALAWCTMREPTASGQPDWLRVEREFVAVTNNWPDRADGFTGLGVARAATGRLELAELDLRRAIGLDPGTSAAHHNLARVLYARGNREAAREHLLEAIRIRPDDAASSALLLQLEREGVR